MAIYDSRPSPFTQLSTMQEWEFFHSALGGRDAVDGPNAFVASFDVPGRNIVAALGNAVIKGQLWRADASFSTAIPAASAQNRLDRLVLRLNRSATTAPTIVVPTIITGTPSGSPTLPAITQTPTGIWDMPICYWTSASSGALSGLTDDRDLIMNDTWHSITPPAGWGGGFNYRMTAERTVMLAGLITLASSGSYNGITIATMPTIYKPIGDKYLPMVSRTQSASFGDNAGSPGLPRVTISSVDGTVKLGGFPASANGDFAYFDGCMYPLDF
jgi:hypothetical protein